MKEWYFGNIVYKQEQQEDIALKSLGVDSSKQQNYIEKERVLVQKLDNSLFKVFALNKESDREYSITETNILLSSELDSDIEYIEEESNYKTVMFPCGIKNLQLVEKGELIPELVSHLGLYLRYQNNYGIYPRDDSNKTKKITL